MDIIIDKACGLDVHKETVVANVSGNGINSETKTFGTFTDDLILLKEWLKGLGVTHVAMESTGIFWKPVFNILGEDFEILLVNARHIKHVPGRKTDIKDSEWICKLLRSGLLRGSFIPPEKIRDIRDLTRYRKKLIENITSEKNRVEKMLESANIKLSSVVSSTFGVNSSMIIEELVKGEKSLDEIVDQITGSLKKKKTDLKRAITGRFTEHHKFMIKTILSHIEGIQKLIEAIDQEIDEKVEEFNKEKELELLQTIPGIGEKAAETIIAEVGTDMSKFPNEHHLCSWAGLSPGNNESAGKKKDVVPHKVIRV